MCRDDQGCRSGSVSRRGRTSFYSVLKAVLLRRVAYSTGLTCTIESTGMCVGLQCTVVLTSAMTMDFSAIAGLLELRTGFTAIHLVFVVIGS